MKRLLLILTVFILCASCDRDTGWNCTRKLGDEITETRFPGNFNELYTYDKVNVEYRHADSCYVEVTYGKNMIEEIETSLQNQRLTIANNTSCNFVRNLSDVPLVVVYAPTLNYFENHSAADFTGHDTIKTGVFKYQQYSSNGEVNLMLHTDTTEIYAHTGFTGITLRGTTFKAELYTASTGKFDASRLISQQTYVNNTSIQDIRCVAMDYLYGVINFSGNIRYSGDPNLIQTDITGTGELIAE